MNLYSLHIYETAVFHDDDNDDDGSLMHVFRVALYTETIINIYTLAERTNKKKTTNQMLQYIRVE